MIFGPSLGVRDWLSAGLALLLFTLLEQIINIFRDVDDNENLGRVKYPAELVSTSVRKDGRFLQTHGGARFAVVGINIKKDKNGNDQENWHTYQRNSPICQPVDG